MKKESGNLIMNWQKPMLWALAFFTLGSMVVALGGEAFKTHLIWHIRFADFVDLVIIAPLYLFTLLLFHAQFLRGRASRRLRWVFLVLSILYLYGHAMHLTANTIDTFSTEIRDCRPLLPDDSYALIYFLDETLSHLIVFISRYSLFACLLALEARCLASAASSRPQWPAVGVGVCGRRSCSPRGKRYGWHRSWWWRWAVSGYGCGDRAVPHSRLSRGAAR